MRRLPMAMMFLVLLLSLPGCGKKNDDSGSSANGGGASGSATASPGVASTLPADLDQGPRAEAEPVNEALVAQGEKLFQSRGCSACHAFGRRVNCPDLDGVTHRRTGKWIESQILHPDLMTKQDPIARQLFGQFALQMPKQGLTEAEAAAVLEFFKHKNHEAGPKH